MQIGVEFIKRTHGLLRRQRIDEDGMDADSADAGLSPMCPVQRIRSNRPGPDVRGQSPLPPSSVQLARCDATRCAEISINALSHQGEQPFRGADADSEHHKAKKRARFT